MTRIIIYHYSRSIPFLFVFSYLIFSGSTCNKEISVTPPDTPPPSGFVYINSNPEGFHIYLDNKERRRITPDSLTWLSTGTYVITLKKNLFKDSTFIISASEKEKHSVFIDFTQNPYMRGNINCVSSPSNAEVFINDSSTGLFTPAILSIMPGNYYVKYRLKYHRDDSVLTTVSSGKTSLAKFTMVDTTLWQDFNPPNAVVPTNNFTCVAVDKNDLVWVGSLSGGYFSFNGDTWKSYYNSLGPLINCIAVDANNIKYIGTYRGMIVIYNESSTVEYGFTSSGFPDFHINAIAPDNNGNCYVGTNKSITKFPSWADFTPVFFDIRIALPITSLVVDKNNNVWAGIKDSCVAKSLSQKLWVSYTSFSSGLINNNVLALALSSSGEIWAGFDNNSVFGNGLSYFDGTNWNKVFPIPPASRTNTIFIDKDDIKWIGTSQGLVKFSSPSGATTFNYDNTGLNITNVTGISQDSHGNIWIATSAGLFEYKGIR